MSKIGIFFATGYEEIEALTVVDLCRRAGMDIQMISVTKERKVTGSHGIEVTMDAIMEETDFEELSMLVLPGGLKGKENLENTPELMAQIDAFAENGKYIAAICASPTIFGHRGLLKGKKAGCYPGMEGELTGANVSFDSVSVDGNIITSRGMGTTIDFALAIIALLKDRATADELAKKVVYQK